MDGTLGAMDSMGSTVEWGVYVGILLLGLELAKRIASLTPGKADDEIVSNIERLVRKVIDFAAGHEARIRKQEVWAAKHDGRIEITLSSTSTTSRWVAPRSPPPSPNGSTSPSQTS